MRKNVTVILTCMLLFALVSCNFGQRDDDLWIVGTSPDNPPYEFMQNDQLMGFDIDLFTEIGTHLKKRIEFKTFDFAGLLPALSSGNIDFVIAGVTVTPERAKSFDFSITYTTTRIAALYRKGESDNGTFDFKDKVIAGQLGSTFEEIAKGLAAEHGGKLSNLSSNLALVEELISKRVDVLILETFQAEAFAREHAGLAFFEMEGQGQSFAIVMQKNSKLKPLIDSAINELQAKGSLTQLQQKWQWFKH